MGGWGSSAAAPRPGAGFSGGGGQRTASRGTVRARTAFSSVASRGARAFRKRTVRKRKQRRASTSPRDRARGRRAVFSRVRGARGGERTLGVPLHAVRRRKLCLRACLSARVRVRACADRRQPRSVCPTDTIREGFLSREPRRVAPKRRRSKTARFAALAFGSILTETHTRFRFFFYDPPRSESRGAPLAFVARAIEPRRIDRFRANSAFDRISPLGRQSCARVAAYLESGSRDRRDAPEPGHRASASRARARGVPRVRPRARRRGGGARCRECRASTVGTVRGGRGAGGSRGRVGRRDLGRYRVVRRARARRATRGRDRRAAVRRDGRGTLGRRGAGPHGGSIR